MQKRSGGDQEVWQRNTLAFSGKLMSQAGCPIPCLIQDWGLFERRQLFIEDCHPFRSFDADEQFCSNRPTYPYGTCYEEFSQSILQIVMTLAIRPNPCAGVNDARPGIRSGHACGGGERNSASVVSKAPVPKACANALRCSNFTSSSRAFAMASRLVRERVNRLASASSR